MEFPGRVEAVRNPSTGEADAEITRAKRLARLARTGERWVQ